MKRFTAIAVLVFVVASGCGDDNDGKLSGAAVATTTAAAATLPPLDTGVMDTVTTKQTGKLPFGYVRNLTVGSTSMAPDRVVTDPLKGSSVTTIGTIKRLVWDRTPRGHILLTVGITEAMWSAVTKAFGATPQADTQLGFSIYKRDAASGTWFQHFGLPSDRRIAGISLLPTRATASGLVDAAFTLVPALTAQTIVGPNLKPTDTKSSAWGGKYAQRQLVASVEKNIDFGHITAMTVGGIKLKADVSREVPVLVVSEDADDPATYSVVGDVVALEWYPGDYVSENYPSGAVLVELAMSRASWNSIASAMGTGKFTPATISFFTFKRTRRDDPGNYYESIRVDAAAPVSGGLRLSTTSGQPGYVTARGYFYTTAPSRAVKLGPTAYLWAGP